MAVLTDGRWQLGFKNITNCHLPSAIHCLQNFAPNLGQTILEFHLYAPDLGQIIPTSEKRASDLGQISPHRA
jgi:hypothetical protein